jgi:transcription-repair coupling factor (superfamily II helicase)
MINVYIFSTISTTLLSPFRFLIQDASFSEAATALWGGESISVDGIVGGSCALTIAALSEHGSGSMIVVTPNSDSAEQIAEDIMLFMEPEYRLNASLKILAFPSMTLHDYESESALAIADESFGGRIGVLKRLVNRAEDRFVIVVSMPALLQPVPPPALLKEQTKTLAVNSRVDLESLRRFLVEGGYHATTAVDLPGEFAVRGYILDLFAPDWEQPVRIEFFNDEIESIRRFDLTTQRSLEKISEIDLTRLQPHECTGASLLDYFSPSVPIVLVEGCVPAGVQPEYRLNTA